MRFALDDWQRLNLGHGQRVPVRVTGKDDAWLFVTSVTELPPVVWVMLARRVRHDPAHGFQTTPEELRGVEHFGVNQPVQTG